MSGTSRSPPLPIWWRTSSHSKRRPKWANASSQQRACASLESTRVPSMSKRMAWRCTGGVGARTLPGEDDPLERGDEARHAIRCCVPKFVDIDERVAVNDPMAHVDDVEPWDV